MDIPDRKQVSVNRQPYLTYSAAHRHPDGFTSAANTFFAADAKINIVHPFNDLNGPAAYHETVISPLKAAFDGLYRRDDIVMAGHFQNGDWISATGYYVGHFHQNWIGIKAPDRLSYLRYGEFHRMENDRAVESYIFLDLPELMIACNQWPIAIGPGLNRGHTGMIQGPATQDGIMTSAPEPTEGKKSYQIVTDMLAGLATKDEAWRPYWHDNMMWYGPGAFGSFVGIDRFASFQVPFESQFDGWSGGSAGNGLTKHFTRFGEGNYTCSGGWPSLTGISIKPFLGQEPTNERVYFRVCDWWRREGELLAENWVFVDVPHALLQFGHNVLPQ
ncbi:hypothetical protein [Yoonia sp. 2307UL14-13]|uniref:hypothetical protein n=1 Tax=Yoonia sp. 2307UL14-13 TaxID=3126506 RepID=UPI0030ADFFE5